MSLLHFNPALVNPRPGPLPPQLDPSQPRVSTSGPANPPKSQISHSEWSRRLAEVNLFKSDMDRLVLDYLIVEGHREAAEEFIREAGVSPEDVDEDEESSDSDAAMMDEDDDINSSRARMPPLPRPKRKAPDLELDGIEERMLIRQAVEAGRIDDAIRRTNDLDPEILDTNPTLFFHLQLQKLIELLRPISPSHSFPPSAISPQSLSLALQFASSTLAPLATPSPALLALLESTLTLLAFPLPPYPANVEHMLSQAQRRERGKELNEAVLESQGRGVESRLVGVCRLVCWGERKLEEQGIGLPRVQGIWTAGEEAEEIRTDGEGGRGGKIADEGSAMSL